MSPHVGATFCVGWCLFISAVFIYLCIFSFLMVASVEYQPKVSDSVKWMHVWCDKRYQTTEVNAAYFIHFVFTVVCVCVCLCVFWVIWVLFTRQGNPLSFRLSSWQPNDFSVVAVGIFDNRVVTLWRWWVWMCIWSFINWCDSAVHTLEWNTSSLWGLFGSELYSFHRHCGLYSQQSLYSVALLRRVQTAWYQPDYSLALTS